MMEKNKIIEQRKKIIYGLEVAYKRLIDFKKSKNSPLVVSKDEKILEIDPRKAQPTTTYKWH